MKQLILLLVCVGFLTPKNLNAQNDGAAVAAVAGGIMAIGAGIVAIEQMKEQAELTATEWFLTNKPESSKFSVKTLSFDGKKLKDMSSTSVITFKIREFDIINNETTLGKKFILAGFTSHGWINEYGINFDKVEWYLIDQNEWLNMMTVYGKIASGETDENLIRETLLNGKIVNRSIKSKDNTINFHKIDGDKYLATDYSSDMKFVYNERSLGIFLKNTKDLVQIGRDDIISIHNYFFENE